jgi:fumarate hydratase class II
VFKPVIIPDVAQSCRIPTDSSLDFPPHSNGHVAPVREHIAENLAKSLMVVTALKPRMGYVRAVKSASSPLRRTSP